MIADDDVHLAGLLVFPAGHVDSPGVDSCHGAPQHPEPAARSQVARVNVKQPDDAQQRDPKQNERGGGSPNPSGSQNADHILSI